MARNVVLLATDSPASREQVAGMLPGGKFEFVTVADGMAALKSIKVEREHLRLLVLTFQLPKVPGWQVLRQVQSHPQLREIPVILLTAAGDPVGSKFREPFEYFEVVALPCDRQRFKPRSSTR
ncbi:MAG: response regulator [Spirulinaceae cyanobacterium RM2_2_10]|nr:response regulator [Spirulinaceae cyanobacterium RM2_2_10]